MVAIDYDRITFTRLTKISQLAIINLMNDPAVRRHLPLAQDEFGDVECDRFIADKECMWEEKGFGPWAFVLDDEFIGWGGLQPEGDDVDLGPAGAFEQKVTLSSEALIGQAFQARNFFEALSL